MRRSEFQYNRRQARNLRSRRGGILVEFAILLPVIFILIFGSIQISNAIFLKQFVTDVAYHASLRGMRLDATEENLTETITEMLAERGIASAVIEIEGPGGLSYDNTPALSPFSVRISIGSGEEYGGPTIMNPFAVAVETYAYKQ